MNLTTVDNEGGSSTLSKDIRINNRPIANFSWSITEVANEINFDGSLSTDIDNDQLSFTWNFGDGTTGAGQKVKHTYPSPQNYVVQLVVKDSVSNSEIIKSITVTAQEDHEEPNITSQGVLAISGEADTKINPLNATIIFEAKDATLSSTALDNLEVSINGHRTSPTVSIQNNLISLSSFLKEGLNSIEISTLDSNELLITGKAEIWAGNNSLTVNPIGSQGTVLAPPFVITSFLAKNTLVKSALSGTTISNLPPEKVLVLLEDANGNLGTAVSNASKTNSMVDVVMYPKTQSDTPQNNDFQEGLSGWNIINGTGSIASHFENGQVFNENKDLTVAGENQIRISRIIDNSLNFRTASLRFLIQTGLEKNDFALVFRGLDSQTVPLFC